jgi:hypothetical protein
MRRRESMLFLGSAMTATRALRAQKKAMPVIGFLSSGLPGTSASLVAVFRQGLGETGYEDLGAAHFDRRRPAAQARRLVKRLAELGFSVQLKSAVAAS